MQVIQCDNWKAFPSVKKPKRLTLSSLTGYANLQVLLHDDLCHKGSVNMQCHHVQSGLFCSCTQVAKIWAIAGVLTSETAVILLLASEEQLPSSKGFLSQYVKRELVVWSGSVCVCYQFPSSHTIISLHSTLEGGSPTLNMCTFTHV